MAHTPGPWRQSVREGDAKRYIVADDSRHGQATGTVLVAQIKLHRAGSADRVCPDDVQNANARLLAAAPALLDALGRLLAAADHAIDDWFNMASDCEQSRAPEAAAEYRGYADAAEAALLDARAAIASAAGV